MIHHYLSQKNITLILYHKNKILKNSMNGLKCEINVIINPEKVK